MGEDMVDANIKFLEFIHTAQVRSSKLEHAMDFLIQMDAFKSMGTEDFRLMIIENMEVLHLQSYLIKMLAESQIARDEQIHALLDKVKELQGG